MIPPHLRAIGEAINSRTKVDPATFALETLGIRPWERQVEILNAVVEHDRVAVRSGHKVGKSTTAAILALWFVTTYPRARVVLTSASSRQVRSILWKEIRRLYLGARKPLGGRLSTDPNTGLQYPDGREIVGFSTDEPEKFTGISGENILFLPDEASGISEEIFDALEGNRAGGAKLVMFSNPTRTVGSFYEAFTTKRDFYHLHHVSSLESPNVAEGKRVIPGLATLEWAEEKLLEHGEGSPFYQVRVLGNFPPEGENTIIGLHLVEAARSRHAETPEEGKLRLGLDVARFGDDESILQPLRGDLALPCVAERKQDGVQIAGRVMEWLERYRQRTGYTLPVDAKIDEIGVGASVVDHLKHSNRARDLGVRVVPVNVATAATSSPSDGPAFAKLRDQIWFATRDWLAGSGAIPDDPRLEAELVAATYGFDSQGRYKVESQEDIKKALGRSPDGANALGLAIYDPPPPRTAGTWGRR